MSGTVAVTVPGVFLGTLISSRFGRPIEAIAHPKQNRKNTPPYLGGQLGQAIRSKACGGKIVAAATIFAAAAASGRVPCGLRQGGAEQGQKQGLFRYEPRFRALQAPGTGSVENAKYAVPFFHIFFVFGD